MNGKSLMVLQGEIKTPPMTPRQIIAIASGGCACMTRLQEIDMKAVKKRRLEAAGWKETTVKEFLNLSEADAQYIQTKLALSRRLRQLREQRHLTQTKAASLLKTSQSRLARMEAGDPSVSLDLLVRGLFALGASWKDLAKA